MKDLQFEFSDTIGGYVDSYDKATRTFSIKTTDGRSFSVKLSANVYAKLMRNLTEPYLDSTGQIEDLLKPGQYLLAYGTFYPEKGSYAFEAQEINFPGKKKDKYRFEEPDWWVKQAASICDFFIKAQFGDEAHIDYKNYRTQISLAGSKTATVRQETDTISRLVYGLASTYMLTGEDKYLEAAEKGTQYLRDHMRFYDTDENIVYWYHGIDITGTGTQGIRLRVRRRLRRHSRVRADLRAGRPDPDLPHYWRSGHHERHQDDHRPFRPLLPDKKGGGYFSHLDPDHARSAQRKPGHNRAQKLEFGGRPCAGLLDQSLAGDRARGYYADFRQDTATTIAAFSRLRPQPVCPGEVP